MFWPIQRARAERPAIIGERIERPQFSTVTQPRLIPRKEKPEFRAASEGLLMASTTPRRRTIWTIRGMSEAKALYFSFL